MKPLSVAVAVMFALVGSLSAQDLGGFREDFLTDHEADVIRVAQEPNDRILAYLHFAHLRLELVDQALASDDKARSRQIHKNIEQYGRIIETIDLVIDDAAIDRVDLGKSMAKLAEAEHEYLARLERIQAQSAPDQWAYEFVLQDAIDITSDSRELALEDLGDRASKVLEADAGEKKKRRTMMTPERRKEVEKAEKEQEEESGAKRKRPTLLKPGEKVGDPRKR